MKEHILAKLVTLIIAGIISTALGVYQGTLLGETFEKCEFKSKNLTSTSTSLTRFSTNSEPEF
ncbi:MAG: hypothetical protein BalsKO_30480 [Balneolaceae bacterium]